MLTLALVEFPCARTEMRGRRPEEEEGGGGEECLIHCSVIQFNVGRKQT